MNHGGYKRVCYEETENDMKDTITTHDGVLVLASWSWRLGRGLTAGWRVLMDLRSREIACRCPDLSHSELARRLIFGIFVSLSVGAASLFVVPVVMHVPVLLRKTMSTQ